MKLKKKAILTRYERRKIDRTNTGIALIAKLPCEVQIYIFKSHVSDSRFHDFIALPICVYSRGRKHSAATWAAQGVLLPVNGDAGSRTDPRCQFVDRDRLTERDF